MNSYFAKRLLIITGIIIAAVIVGMVLIHDRGVETDITAKTTKVGLVVTGSRNDSSFCQTHYSALKSIKDELNLEIICMEHIPEDEACSAAMEELIGEMGCEFIIGASYGYGEYIVETAKKHPEVCFLHPAGSEKLANLTSCFGRMYQARYLSGIVAGMRSGTGKIGYVAAFPYSEVIRGINAFTLGVRSVAPEARIYVRYCNSWVDDNAAETVTLELLDKHPDIDVLSVHTNSLMPNNVAEIRGIWSVGYNMDNVRLFPVSYLTACELKWDTYYRQEILSFLQGKFHGDIEWLDMESGIVGLSELTPNAVPGTKEAVERVRELFASRSFDVFYGPVTDNNGVVRVPDGESMSDDEMMNRFDWYVEGVTVEE